LAFAHRTLAIRSIFFAHPSISADAPVVTDVPNFGEFGGVGNWKLKGAC
jgi:hypothetical protein